MSGDSFSIWKLAKKYNGAHFYLKNERTINLTDAQRTNLSAIHLQITYGNFVDGLSVEDQAIGGTEKRRREEEWKLLANITKAVLMRKFISIITELCPNWFLHKRLYDEFEMEW
jgi:hypothetical protein